MRPIETQESLNKRKKRNQLIVGTILIGLMVMSSAGYALINSFSGSSTQLQEKYGLVYDGSYWTGNVQGSTLSLSLDPDEASKIPVNLGGLTLTSYTGQTVYVVTNGDAFSLSQIATNLGPLTNTVQEACLGSCEKNLPEKTCNDMLIVLNSSATPSRVYRNQNCLFVDGNSDSTEAFLYHLFGILP